MDAVIFDFDGVVVDSEPIHYFGFQQVLKTLGVELSREDYYAKYLGFDDHDCIAAVAADTGCQLGEHRIEQLTQTKTRIVQRAFRESIEAMPGAVRLIQALDRRRVPLAICSGALREEIRLAAETVGVLECFGPIVSAEDVARGKPDPEGYRKALERLERNLAGHLLPRKCIVVEDSPAGIEAGKVAGMQVLAVTASYPREALAVADRVVASLEEVAPEDLDRLLAPRDLTR